MVLNADNQLQHQQGDSQRTPHQQPLPTQSCMSVTNAGTDCRGQTNNLHLPAVLHGARCYTDASLLSDNSASTRTAGLGVFLLNPGNTSSTTLYVQARIAGIQSVLMAEAAAAARVAKQLSLSSVNFLTDNQSMPNFYNSRDLFNPPHWNIKT